MEKLRKLTMKNRGSQKSKSNHSRSRYRRSPRSPSPDETWAASFKRAFGID